MFHITESATGRARAAGCWLCGGVVVAVLGAGGCHSNTPSATQSDSDRQDQALRDPMNYSVNPPSVDGGHTSSLDHQGISRDMNDVFNP